jgi:nicotinamide mononucleotide adenylyltransferase
MVVLTLAELIKSAEEIAICIGKKQDNICLQNHFTLHSRGKLKLLDHNQIDLYHVGECTSFGDSLNSRW